MKIEIWTPPEPKPEEEKVLRVRLEPHGDTVSTYLYAVDEYGNNMPSGRLVILRPGGLERIQAVNPALGLPLDEGGRVKLVGE